MKAFLPAACSPKQRSGRTCSPFGREWKYNTAIGWDDVIAVDAVHPLSFALTFCNCSKGESVPS